MSAMDSTSAPPQAPADPLLRRVAELQAALAVAQGAGDAALERRLAELRRLGAEALAHIEGGHLSEALRALRELLKETP